MGQKVNPKGIRTGITHGWNSKWYSNKKNFKKLLHQDLAIQTFFDNNVEQDGVSKIEILRMQGRVILNVHTSKPGLIIGRGGELIQKLTEKLERKFNEKFSINIKEIRKPMVDATIVAKNIVSQIERRISYRRAAKVIMDKVMESGAKGVKIYLGGRLNGVEIARSEFFSKGKIPLHTFRADIDYASIPAKTTYGQIGVKVWIYKGDIFKKDLKSKIVKEIQEIKQV